MKERRRSILKSTNHHLRKRCKRLTFGRSLLCQSISEDGTVSVFEDSIALLCDKLYSSTPIKKKPIRPKSKKKQGILCQLLKFIYNTEDEGDKITIRNTLSNARKSSLDIKSDRLPLLDSEPASDTSISAVTPRKSLLPKKSLSSK